MEMPFFGSVELFPYNFAPLNYKLCNGTTLPNQQYQALFALLGYNFGGDRTNNFAVPNLLGAEPFPGTNYYISLDGLWPENSN